MEKEFEFRKKGNKIQHDFKEKIKATMEETASLLENDGNIPKAKEALQQGINKVNKRQKLIKIADRSKNGWLTAQEYQADDLAENSDDEKRIAQAERQAERRRKKRGTARITFYRCDCIKRWQTVPLLNKEELETCSRATLTTSTIRYVHTHTLLN